MEVLGRFRRKSEKRLSYRRRISLRNKIGK
jgi:hypothetical protein